VRVGEGEDDLFIPPFAMGAALHGDLVVASYLESRREGDAHEIVEVLERTPAGIVGRLEARGRLTLLQPERPEYPREILLALHGRSSVPRNRRAVVRLDPKPPEPLQGRVVAVLGEDDPREDSWVVALEEGLHTEFRPEALSEAAAFADQRTKGKYHGQIESLKRTVAGLGGYAAPEPPVTGQAVITPTPAPTDERPTPYPRG